MPQQSAKIYAASTTETLQLWHERLCHQEKSHVQCFLKQRGIEVVVDEEFCEESTGSNIEKALELERIDQLNQVTLYMLTYVGLCRISQLLVQGTMSVSKMTSQSTNESFSQTEV